MNHAARLVRPDTSDFKAALGKSWQQEATDLDLQHNKHPCAQIVTARLLFTLSEAAMT